MGEKKLTKAELKEAEREKMMKSKDSLIVSPAPSPTCRDQKIADNEQHGLRA